MRKTLAIVGLALLASPTVAQTQCDSLQTPNDILRCVLESHADVKVGKSLVDEASLGMSIADQQPNPEFELEVSDSLGSGFGTGVALLHTIERGGKKRARRRLASAEHAQSKVSLMAKKDAIVVDTVVTLYRIRQIDHELEINGEIIDTFDKIISRYKAAGRLAPEQKVSISVFNLALEENRLNRSSLKSERQELVSQLQNAMGKEIEITRAQLPRVVKTWKRLEKSPPAKGNQVKMVQSDLALARARVLLEEAEAASDISIGPTIGFEHDDPASLSVGVALSMPLPLYHQNNGSRAKARAEVRTNSARLDATRALLASRRTYLHRIYNSARGAIAKTLSNAEIEVNHQELHSMIERGVVSASIIIELHRQILEFYDKLHQQELAGIEALWQLHTINGTAQSEILK